MSPETVTILIEGISTCLGAAALALGFYVRATVGEQITTKCDLLRATFDARTEAVTSGLYARINAFGDRVQSLESKVDDTARRDDLHRLSLQLSEMGGDLKAITAKMGSIDESARVNSAALKRVENHIFKVEGA